MLQREWPERFAVAFSLAGEQRELVHQVAQEVEDLLGRSTVFYDEWYEHAIAGDGSDVMLQRLYGTGCELVVVCVSQNYADKPWTQVEHKAVRARLMAAASDADRLAVLPVRVGAGDVDGILVTDIVPDLRNRTVAAAANLVVARLNLLRGSRVGTVPPAAGWPADPPELNWPMADHHAARAAFGRLLCDASPARALLVRGASDTGKSHMSRQMLTNGFALDGVSFGRFDFKGTTQMDIELQAFCQSLDVEEPQGRTLNERLGKVFGELRRRARPTVLIFDTYESAGEAKEWIESVALPHLVSAAWLRVVVTGQTVPSRPGTIWESVAEPTLVLELPGPADWLAYAQLRQVEVTLEFVTQAHQLVAGKATALANLLGPQG